MRRRDASALFALLGLMLWLSGCFDSHMRSVPTPTPVSPPIAADASVPPIAADASVAAPDGAIDADGDGYPIGVDCNDNNPTIHPGALEYACGLDGIDSNCDGWDLSEECETDPDCLMWLCNG